MVKVELRMCCNGCEGSPDHWPAWHVHLYKVVDWPAVLPVDSFLELETDNSIDPDFEWAECALQVDMVNWTEGESGISVDLDTYDEFYPYALAEFLDIVAELGWYPQTAPIPDMEALVAEQSAEDDDPFDLDTPE